MKSKKHKILPGRTVVSLYENEMTTGVSFGHAVYGTEYFVHTKYPTSTYQKRQVRFQMVHPADAPAVFSSVVGMIRHDNELYVVYQLDP